MNPEVLMIGCGFLGEAAADLFCAGGKNVLGLVRSPESAHASAHSQRSFSSQRYFRIAACDVTDPASVEVLAPQVRGVPLAIYAVSSGRGGAEAYAAVYRDGLRRIIESWNPGKVLFVSSTSVYGQCDGAWVTEESPAIPSRETGRILLEAEQIALSAGGCVARLSGIYGPGRSVLLRKFLAGEARLEDGGERWINQIHRDDAAAALVRLGDPELPSGIFNVSDHTPAMQREVYGWIAEFLRRPLPPDGPPELDRKRGWSSKRISNGHLHSLGWSPKFPSYRDALPQLMESFHGYSSE